MGRLSNKVCLITGCASVPGLGSATAIRFAQEGAIVYLSDIDGAGAEAVAKGIRDSGGRARAFTHDVTKESDWDRVMGTLIANEGRIDVLVNNAGVAVLRMFDAFTTADWIKQNDVNLNSVFYGTHRAVKEMRRVGKGGSIINLSSTAGLVGVPGCTAYAAAKGGVRLFSKAVAIECAREGIRCNSVHPGMIWTNMQKVALQDNAANFDAVVGGIPMGRMGEPLDIANMNLFLASDESTYITGAEFVVDGGATAV
jgi:NAD(P)-dependent dehydrogenase (short-subunit alcohol dehydrogenase family)